MVVSIKERSDAAVTFKVLGLLVNFPLENSLLHSETTEMKACFSLSVKEHRQYNTETLQFTLLHGFYSQRPNTMLSCACVRFDLSQFVFLLSVVKISNNRKMSVFVHMRRL